MKYKITFEDEQFTCLAEAGTTVLEAQIAAGMTPDAFCGGNGKCGKCKVVIDGKEVLACKTAVDRDMTVYTGNKKEFSDSGKYLLNYALRLKATL